MIIGFLADKIPYKVRKFSWESAAEKVINLYKELIQ